MGLLEGLLRSGACVSQSWANPVVFGLPHAGYLRVLRTRDWLPLEEAFTATTPAALSERRALLAFSRQQLSTALDQASHALALDPDRPLAHYLRAVALLAATSGMTMPTTRDAEIALRRAIAAAPALAPAYTTLGGLLAARDGPSLEARMLIQRAITLDPSAIGHQVALGQVLLMSGDTVEGAAGGRACAGRGTDADRARKRRAAAGRRSEAAVAHGTARTPGAGRVTKCVARCAASGCVAANFSITRRAKSSAPSARTSAHTLPPNPAPNAEAAIAPSSRARRCSVIVSGI